MMAEVRLLYYSNPKLTMKRAFDRTCIEIDVLYERKILAERLKQATTRTEESSQKTRLVYK